MKTIVFWVGKLIFVWCWDKSKISLLVYLVLFISISEILLLSLLERILFRENDLGVVNSLTLNGRLFLAPREHLDAVVSFSAFQSSFIFYTWLFPSFRILSHCDIVPFFVLFLCFLLLHKCIPFKKIEVTLMSNALEMMWINSKSSRPLDEQI